MLRARTFVLGALLCGFCLLVALALQRTAGAGATSERVPQIALLIPDALALEDPQVSIWRDAAGEEGVPLTVVRVSEYLRPVIGEARRDFAGIILPDTVHQSAGRVLLNRLGEDVRAGGWLMLVYDAATHSARDRWYAGKAPLSSLVGIDYGLYEELRDKTFESGAVLVPQDAMRLLAIPPGKIVPYGAAVDAASTPGTGALSGYTYGQLRYPAIVTRGPYAGRAILRTSGGSLVAGVREVGRGGVLFVNLPLGYLKGQTDGLPLHCFLRYFATQTLHLPCLLASPGGIGGLVFNWHVDSNAAIAPIKELDTLGLLEQGPFSIHFTAGPDTYQIGDGTGLSLNGNKELAPWIARFRQRGDALGSHGGWIHNYFGLNVNEHNQAQMQQYLELNNQAVQAVSGAPVLEYSAPIGNQPQWVTAWLQEHGVLAYYFTGNSGMAPTRSYRDGALGARQIWSFPIAILGDIASFEEASEAAMAPEAVTKWLIDLSDFAADSSSVRTIYSHPTGWHRYTLSIQDWFAHTRALLAQGKFRWYTMTRIAEFLNRRELVQWSVSTVGGAEVIAARHPDSLAEMTWQLPKRYFDRPSVDVGQAAVGETAEAWRVVAGNGRELRFTSRILEQTL